jgi:hypothetical protein
MASESSEVWMRSGHHRDRSTTARRDLRDGYHIDELADNWPANAKKISRVFLLVKPGLEQGAGPFFAAMTELQS